MKNARFAAVSCAAVAALSGCMLGPDFERPSSDGVAPEVFRRSEPAATGVDAAEDMGCCGMSLPEPESPDKSWWSAWSDPQIKRLVDEACATNIPLAQAVARVRQARASLATANATLRPSLGLSGSASANKTYDPDASSRAVRGGGEVAWEIDLFGANRRSVEAAEAETDAALQEEAGVRLELAAETASAYVQLRLAEALLAISRENLESAEESLEIAKAKDSSGMEAGSGLAASEASVATARAAVPSREAAVSAAARAVEAILARPPFALEESLIGSGEVSAVPEAPEPPEASPAEILARRPDVLRAEASLHAATARIGAARAARYPSVNLAAGVSVSASSLTDWERTTTDLTLGPSVSIPLFRGGALKAAEERARAAADEALLSWRDTVLSAVHEAQEAWTRFDAENARRADVALAAAKEEEALEAALSLWKAGSGSYEAVISRRQALLSARQSVAQNAADRALLAIILYKVLGGAP